MHDLARKNADLVHLVNKGGLANHYQNRAMPKNGGSLVLVNGPGARA